MSSDPIITPQQFARLCAFLRYPVDETAGALAGEVFALPPADAAALATDAWRERGDIGVREEHELDKLAVDSEWDLDANHFSERTAAPLHTADLEQTIRTAFRVALAFRRTGRGLDALCALVHGAFGLDPVLAYQVAAAAAGEYPLIDDEGS